MTKLYDKLRLTVLVLVLSHTLSAPGNASTLKGSGAISTDVMSVSIYVFEGVPVKEDFDFGTFDFEMNHNPTTGQITGEGYVKIKDVVYTEKYVYTEGDLDGAMKFSAKPLKRGSIVSLSGAKVSAVTQRTGDVQIYDYGTWQSYPFTFSSTSNFSFSSLSVDVSQQTPLFSGAIRPGRLAVRGRPESCSRTRTRLHPPLGV